MPTISDMMRAKDEEIAALALRVETAETALAAKTAEIEALRADHDALVARVAALEV